jgi:hypothetical protein
MVFANSSAHHCLQERSMSHFELRHPLQRRSALKFLAAGAASLALPAFAAWPDKPIKIVVTFPAGGASDIVARVMAEQLTTKLGQAVVVDNRPGAGGSVGGLVVTQAPADGYTLMLSQLDADLDRPVRAGKAALRPGGGLHPHRADRQRALRGDGQPQGRPEDHGRPGSMRARKPAGSTSAPGGPASIGHIYGELMKATLGVNMVSTCRTAAARP